VSNQNRVSFCLRTMGRCSSCGTDLSGFGELCHECYLAQQAASTAVKDSSTNRTSYIYSLLWIFVSYTFVTYMSDSAKVLVLVVGLLLAWYLFLWAISQRRRKRYSIQQETFSLILGFCCGVVWKITDADVWMRLGVACIFVSTGYRTVYRAMDRAKATHR
jgi:hypothetical protein